MNRADVSKMAEAAGFGGAARNTHRVKLERFAGMVRERAYTEALETVVELTRAAKETGGETLSATTLEHVGIILLGRSRVARVIAP